MIIDSYEVQSSAQRSYTKVESSISTTKWVSEASLGLDKEAAWVNLSQETAKQLAGQAEANGQPLEGFKSYQPAAVKWSYDLPSNPTELKARLLAQMLSAMTGKRISVMEWKPLSNSQQQQQLSLSQILGGGGNVSRTEPIRQVTKVQQFSYESESLQYQAQGLIKTADGKTISVDISMSMSREFVSYTSASVIWEKPKDPLVINYAGSAASLTEQKYSFDLTMDGNLEQMSFVGSGSGFLAVDWNGDGVINDGGELFGPQSGDGFDELRAYDADGNGWIDEADDIFAKLVVWSKDEDGNDQLFTLKQLGIGAIFLGNVETQFSLTDDRNNTHGLLQSTSFFLKEDGGAGTVSRIDLVV